MVHVASINWGGSPRAAGARRSSARYGPGLWNYYWARLSTAGLSSGLKCHRARVAMQYRRRGPSASSPAATAAMR